MAWRYLLFRLRMLRFALRVKPVMGAEDPPDPKDAPPKDDPPKDDPPKDDPPDDPIKPEDDWMAKARKHERDAKKARKERETLEQRLKELEEADKSEQQKAIDKAREEGKKEALTEAEKERRSDRLEVGVTRLAAKGIEVGEGDDKKTIRFADTEDALLHVERGIARGDIDSEDIFDGEGKVNTDSLQEALGELLRRKPHLAADGKPPPAGDPDSRKGDPAQKDLESMTPEDHAKRKYATK